MFKIELLAVYSVFFPLLGALWIGLNTRKFTALSAQLITTSMLCFSAIFSVIVFYHVVFLHEVIHIRLLKWVDISFFQAYWSIYVDSLTAVMLFVVTFVSCLVHIYSIGYMEDDDSKQRFMSYLSLFTFFMLMLVTSDNLLQLFLGWEGVGLSSFLLIGFWFKKESASKAALKAFLVNRVGDVGLALSIFLIAVTFKSIEYQQIFASLSGIEVVYAKFFGIELSTMDIICILMLIGCMGKSAQLGLHTWLPDAMEGPTPVSALIHAATMVTAGVFLLARCSFLFEHSQMALNTVTVIGAFTCLFAASIALVQTDIKKIIAYSTSSQLGYMFFACGVSAYSVAIFHLMTHAFFKALLFLGAGSVIHAIHNEQDINKMGGLYKFLPVTYAFMWIGSLALAGIFPFAGYFSKDLILEHAHLAGSGLGTFAYWMGLFAALCTAFYSWRLIILVFHKSSRVNCEAESEEHIHEAPKSMMVPMILLAVGAVFSGYVGEYIFKISSPNSSFWNGALAAHAHGGDDSSKFVKILPLVIAVSGIMLAYITYFRNSSFMYIIIDRLRLIREVLYNKYYFDEIYNRIFVVTIKDLSDFLWKWFDNSIIDGIPNSLARMTFDISRVARHVQTGKVYHYLFTMLMGILAIVSIVIFS